MATTSEMETTVTYDHQEGLYRIWSSYRPHIRKFQNDSRATEAKSGEEFSEFTIPADQFDVTKGFKRRFTMSDEQKQAAADRLRKAREGSK